MSFDVYLFAFADGAPVPVDRARVLAALDGVEREAIGEGNYYHISAADGGTAEFSASGLSGTEPMTGCAFFLRGWTPGIMDVIYAVAARGRMVIIPTMQGAGFIITAEEHAAELPSAPDLPAPVVCHSGAELGAILEGGFEQWQAYRDQVLASLDPRG